MSDTQSLQAHILAQLDTLPQPSRIWLAFSGGLDSTCLLHLLVSQNQQLCAPHAIIALHVNHQLSPNADSWQAHCQTVAQALACDFKALKVKVKVEGKGIEAAAREARYTAFEQQMGEGDVLMTAHHQQDQTETFFLRLMRGAGVTGLQGIRQQRSFSKGSLRRPLLGFSRSVLEHYAQEHSLKWIEDESNQDDRFDRNFLRQSVLPLIISRWHQLDSNIETVIAHQQEAEALLTDLAQLDWQSIAQKNTRLGVALQWQDLTNLSASRRHNLLRYWSQKYSRYRVNLRALIEVDRQFFQKAPNNETCVSWGEPGRCLRFFEGFVYLCWVSSIHDQSRHSQWPQNDDQLPAFHLRRDVVTPKLAPKSNRLLDKKWLKHPWQVRYRQGGERCQPAERDRSQQVKKLLQEVHLETWLRGEVPLIYIDDALAAVGDLWVCKGFESQSESEGVRILWDCQGDGYER